MSIQYKDATDTKTGPSPSVWGNCPVADFLERPDTGLYQFDDFDRSPILTTPTITTQANYGNGYKAFGSSGGTIVPGTGQYGDIVLTETDDNEAVILADINLPFKIIRGGGDVWFECRLKTNTITDARHGIFVGFVEQQTLAAIIPIVDAGTLADANFVGFHRLEGDGDKVDCIYKANGVTEVTVQADAATLVADTYIKLGMRYKDANSTLYFYVDGAQVASVVVIAAAGTDFPNDVTMGKCLAVKCASADDAIVTMDWWGAAQARVS